MSTKGFALLALITLTSCRAEEQRTFPEAHRPVAPIVSDAFSTEDVRDRAGEFEQVVALAGVKPGMWVADIGAGEGYYTVRLAPLVGRAGRGCERTLPTLRPARDGRSGRTSRRAV